MNVNKVIVPEGVGDTTGEIFRKDGKVVRYEHGNMANVYLFHETDEEGTQRAFEIVMPLPMTRAKCINAAEMAAYGLQDAMDVAAFASSLSRKERTGEDLEEVREHDDFIAQVKVELTALGIV